MYIEHDKRRNTYVVRWRNAAGEKKRDTFVWNSAKEAKARLDFLVGQGKNVALGIYKEITFSEAIIVFLRLHGPSLANEEGLRGLEYKLRKLDSYFGPKILSKINYQDVATCWDEWAKAGYTVNTILRHMGVLNTLFERFKFWNALVPDVMPEKIAIPETNPVKIAREYLRHKRDKNKASIVSATSRERRVPRDELAQAKIWCQEHDTDLWKAIGLSIWTALRKSDSTRLKAGESVNLIQAKTGNKQVMPIRIMELPNFVNLKKRWNHLRDFMGWRKKGTPRHTTWHDLRHVAPSILADHGFSAQVIAQYLGQSSEKMARTYTHPSGEVLIPAVKCIQQSLESL